MKTENSTLNAKIEINKNSFLVFFTIGIAQKEMVLDTRSKMVNAKLSEQKAVNDRIENNSIKYDSYNAKASIKTQNAITHSLLRNANHSFPFLDQFNCTIYTSNNPNEHKNAPIVVIIYLTALTGIAIEALFPSIERRNNSKGQTIYPYRIAFQSLNGSIYPLKVSIFPAEASIYTREVSADTLGASSGTPGVSADTPGVSSVTREVSSGTPGVSAVAPDASSGTREVSAAAREVSRGTPEASEGAPDASSGTPEVSAGTPEASLGPPGVSADIPRASTAANAIFL